MASARGAEQTPPARPSFGCTSSISVVFKMFPEFSCSASVQFVNIQNINKAAFKRVLAFPFVAAAQPHDATEAKCWSTRVQTPGGF